MIKCTHLKLRTLKGNKYTYCTLKRLESTLKCEICLYCNDKEYKKVKTIKKVSKKRIFVSEKTYEQVFDRDKGICRLCGNNNIQLHHIIYRSERKHLIDEPNNCIMLCLSCHELVHSNKKEYQDRLKELIDNDTCNRSR